MKCFLDCVDVDVELVFGIEVVYFVVIVVELEYVVSVGDCVVE